MFPHLFLGAMNKFYYKRDKEWSFEKYLKRINEMTALEKTITPVWKTSIPLFMKRLIKGRTEKLE